jgi:hypothetical protein
MCRLMNGTEPQWKVTVRLDVRCMIARKTAPAQSQMLLHCCCVRAGGAVEAAKEEISKEIAMSPEGRVPITSTFERSSEEPYGPGG